MTHVTRAQLCSARRTRLLRIATSPGLTARTILSTLLCFCMIAVSSARAFPQKRQGAGETRGVAANTGASSGESKFTDSV